jgi:hypothetical protein
MSSACSCSSVAATLGADGTSTATKSVGSAGQCGGRCTNRQEPLGSGESAEATSEQRASWEAHPSKPTIQPRDAAASAMADNKKMSGEV